MIASPAVSGGLIDDLEREDDGRGYERDETDAFHQLVRHLIVDGNRRAATPAGIGMEDDACPLCGRWSCTGSDCPPASIMYFAAQPTDSDPDMDEALRRVRQQGK